MDSTIKSLVLNTLSSIPYPITFLKNDSEDDTFITFFEYLDQGEGYAEDAEDQTGHYIQIDVWYKDDIGTLCKDIMDLLKAQDFTKKEIRDIGWDEPTQRYHSVVSVAYLQQN